MTPEQDFPTMVVGIFSALIAVITALVSVLTWFLRRLMRSTERFHNVTIPNMLTVFKNEMKAERESCDSRFEKITAAIVKNQETISQNQQAIGAILETTRKHYEDFKRPPRN